MHEIHWFAAFRIIIPVGTCEDDRNIEFRREPSKNPDMPELEA